MRPYRDPRRRPASIRQLVALDPYRPLRAWEARAAVPRGSERPRSPHDALHALQADPRLANLRSDFAGHVCAWLEHHARSAQWADDPSRASVRCVSFPGRARVCSSTGMSEATYKRARRLLEEWGYVGLVRAGWTPALRAGGLSDPDAANRAAVYVLAVPRRRPELAPPHARWKPDPRPPSSLSAVTDPLTGFRSGFLRNHAREANPDTRTPPATAPLRPPDGVLQATSERAAAHWPAHASALRAASRDRCSNRGASYAAAPFAAAGWTPAQLRYALSTRPDGQLHPHRAQTVRLGYAWIAYRLGFWLDDDGTPVDFPAAAAAELARRAAERAELVTRRRAAPTSPAPADPAPHAAAIRARLGWKPPTEEHSHGYPERPPQAPPGSA